MLSPFQEVEPTVEEIGGPGLPPKLVPTRDVQSDNERGRTGMHMIKTPGKACYIFGRPVKTHLPHRRTNRLCHCSHKLCA